MSDPSRKIKLELDTTLEWTLSAVGCVGVIWALTSLLPLVEGWQKYSYRPERWYLPGFLLLVALSWGLRAALDEHYILDLDERKLFFHRKFARWKWLIPVASCEHFVAFAVQGKYESNKSGDYWDYTPVLVTRDKRILRLADASRDNDGFEQASKRARELADLTGTALHPPEPERTLQVTAPGPTVAYVPQPPTRYLLMAVIATSIVIGVGIAVSLLLYP